MMIDIYMKAKKWTFGDKVYTNFRDLNMPGDDIKCEYFTAISIWLLYTKTNITCKYI